MASRVSGIGSRPSGRSGTVHSASAVRRGRARAQVEALPVLLPETGLNVRARILSAASRLLATSGFGALTQPRVSRAAGISQSHLTYYFPRRADLMLAVARHALAQTVERVRSAARERPQRRLARTVHALQQRMSDQRVVRLMLGVIVASEEDRTIKASIAEFVDAVRRKLHEMLREVGLAADAKTVASVHTLAVGLAVLNVARDTRASRAEVGEILRFALPRIAGVGHKAVKGAARTRATPKKRHEN